MAMSYSRHEELLRSVPANSRKLYELIPIGEAWSYIQIHQEAQRQGMNLRSEVVMACVRTLEDTGLVYQPEQHRFRRAPHKPRPQVKTTTITLEKEESMSNTTVGGTMALIKTTEKAPKPLMDRLSDVSSRIRKLADDMKEVADDLDDLALVAGEQQSVDGAELKKLRDFANAFRALAPGA